MKKLNGELSMELRKKSWHQQVREKDEEIKYLKSSLIWQSRILNKIRGQRDFFKKYSQRVCDEPRELDEK